MLILFFVILQFYYFNSVFSFQSESEKSLFSIEGSVLINDQDFGIRNFIIEWIRNTRIIIDDGFHSTYLTVTGNFSFVGLSEGNYLLTVVSPNHYFDPVLIHIGSDGSVFASHIGEVDKELPYPLIFSSKTRSNYQSLNEEYNIYSVFSNPVVFLGLVKLQSFLSGLIEEEKGNSDSLTTKKLPIKEAIDWVFSQNDD